MNLLSSVAPLTRRSLSPMIGLPDLVRDSKLETHHPADRSGDTIHIFTRQRGATKKERWRFKSLIGNGGEGAVWLEGKVTIPATSAPTALRAVKTIKVHEPRGPKSPNQLSLAEEYVRQLEALAKFSQYKYSGCFVKFYGWWERTDPHRYLCIAMEYCPLGDLESYISSSGPLHVDDAQEITAQVLHGLCYMHEEGFAHRDLKPANILIKSSPPDRWWVVICDHGLSKRVEDAAASTTVVKGTPLFISPERRGFHQDIVPEKADPYAADMWCLGETAFRLLCGQPAFGLDDMLRQFARGSLNFPTDGLRNANVDDQAIEFVTSIMHPEPNRRLTCFQARAHAWMKVNETQEEPSSSELDAHSLDNLESNLEPNTLQQREQPLYIQIPVSKPVSMPTTATQSSRAWSPVTQPLQDISSEAPSNIAEQNDDEISTSTKCFMKEQLSPDEEPKSKPSPLGCRSSHHSLRSSHSRDRNRDSQEPQLAIKLQTKAKQPRAVDPLATAAVTYAAAEALSPSGSPPLLDHQEDKDLPNLSHQMNMNPEDSGLPDDGSRESNSLRGDRDRDRHHRRRRDSYRSHYSSRSQDKDSKEPRSHSINKRQAYRSLDKDKGRAKEHKETKGKGREADPEPEPERRHGRSSQQSKLKIEDMRRKARHEERRKAQVKQDDKKTAGIKVAFKKLFSGT